MFDFWHGFPAVAKSHDTSAQRPGVEEAGMPHLEGVMVIGNQEDGCREYLSV